MTSWVGPPCLLVLRPFTLHVQLQPGRLSSQTIWGEIETGQYPWLLISMECSENLLGFLNYHTRAIITHSWSVVAWLIVYQLGILSLSCSQYSQTICLSGWDDNPCLGVRNTCSIGAWPNSLDRRPPWYFIVSPLLQKTKTNFFVLDILDSEES